MSTSALAINRSTRSRPSSLLRFAATERRLRKQIVGAGFGRRPGTLAGTLDADDVGTQVTEEHRGVWPWTDAGQFDDSQSVQWSSHALTALQPVAQLTADIAYLYNQVGPAEGIGPRSRVHK